MSSKQICTGFWLLDLFFIDNCHCLRWKCLHVFKWGVVSYIMNDFKIFINFWIENYECFVFIASSSFWLIVRCAHEFWGTWTSYSCLWPLTLVGKGLLVENGVFYLKWDSGPHRYAKSLVCIVLRKVAWREYVVIYAGVAFRGSSSIIFVQKIILSFAIESKRLSGCFFFKLYINLIKCRFIFGSCWLVWA